MRVGAESEVSIGPAYGATASREKDSRGLVLERPAGFAADFAAARVR
jgi:hypothetical protein